MNENQLTKKENKCIEELKKKGYTVYVWDNGQIVVSNETDKNPYDNDYTYEYAKDFLSICKKFNMWHEAYDAGTIFIGTEKQKVTQ